MGTSGAFGGSDTVGWNEVARYVSEVDAGPGEGGSQESDVTEPGSDSDSDEIPATTKELAALVAEALLADDPAMRPKWAPARSPGDSGLFFGSLVGRTRLRGTSKEPPRSGRRRIARAAGRAGRAVGAGYALSSGNAQALAEYGLELADLEGLDRYAQIFAIMEAVQVGGAGPDDIALRDALFEALNRVLDPEAGAPSPASTLRELVGTYALHLLDIEFDALIQKGDIPAERVNSHRADLRDYLRIRASALNLDAASLTTSRQFEHAARELMRATLDLIKTGYS